MACIDCLDNCQDPNLTDKCVTSTLDDNDTIGICRNNSLFTNMTAIVAYLDTFVDGSGISLSGLTGCSLLPLTTGSLDDITQGLYTAICGLKTDLTTLQAQVNPSISFNTECLTIVANPTQAQVLQATVAKACELDGRIEAIETDYIRTEDICSVVTQCITDSGAVTQEYQRMPKYVALPYHGPLTVFDSSGRGIAAQGYDKVYMCLGQTVNSFTLPDYRGRSPVGVNTSLPGGAMDSAVDPSNIINAGYSISLNTKKGEYAHILTTLENAPHTHSVNDPGHSHTYNTLDGTNGGVLSSGGFATNHSTHYITPQTSTVVTGITLGSSGNGQAHNNTHPVIGAVFIMYIP